jgi:hypothetical protein
MTPIHDTRQFAMGEAVPFFPANPSGILTKTSATIQERPGDRSIVSARHGACRPAVAGCPDVTEKSS